MARHHQARLTGLMGNSRDSRIIEDSFEMIYLFHFGPIVHLPFWPESITMQIKVAQLRLLEQDALEAARNAALEYRRSAPASLSLHPDQGFFSMTFIANFDDGTQCIIQLRDNSIDTALVHLARGILGTIVPDIQTVEATRSIYAYGMSLISGTRWNPLVEMSVEMDALVAKEMGTILARCSLSLKSDILVDSLIVRLDCIVHRLKKICSDDIPVELMGALLTRIEGLRDRGTNLKQLDLALCHTDPNPFNIVISDTESPHIIGLIDWEGATIFPFGMNAYQIRLICVFNRHGVDDAPDNTADPVAIAFWEGLTNAVPDVDKGAVIDAMEIGLILIQVFWDGAPCPTANMVKNTIERIDWLENMYRPLCKTRI